MVLHYLQFYFRIEQNQDNNGCSFKFIDRLFNAEDMESASYFIQELVDEIPEDRRSDILKNHLS
jgi:hypothetical protein